MVRDILDFEGVKIGELELDDETTESEWAERLAVFAAPPAVIIPPVSARQIRLALLHEGVTPEQMLDLIDTLFEPEKSVAKIDWRFSSVFRREDSIITSIGVLLEYTSEELDNLMLLAKEF